MIRSIVLTLLGLIALLGTSHAAVLITIDDQGATQMDVFDNQVYYHLEGGNLESRIDLNTNTCSMFFHEYQVQIESKCDQAQKEMDAAMSASLQQQGMSREQIMAMQKMMAQNRPQTIEIEPAGSATIAGYSTECFSLGDTRRMCISAAVTALIEREFSFKKMITLMRQFEGGMMGREPSAADKAEQQLWEKGYVMKDVDLASAMPNADLLQMMPEAARQQMMQQLRQSGAKPEGTVVVKVEKNATFTPDAPNYPKKSMRDFAEQMMSR